MDRRIAAVGDSDCKRADLPESAIGTLAFGGEPVPASMANEKGWRRRPKDREYTLDFAATLGGKLVAGCVEINQCVGCSRRLRGGGCDDSARTRRKIWISTQVAGKRLYHPVKCSADAKLGALARGMAQGHNSMETMSTPRQDMLVGALEGFLEDLPSS